MEEKYNKEEKNLERDNVIVNVKENVKEPEKDNKNICPYFLCIRINPNKYSGDYSFMEITDTWIYAISDNPYFLDNFQKKIESYTPLEYRQYMDIYIKNYNELNPDIIKKNKLNLHKDGRVDINGDFFPEWNKIYIEGLINTNNDYSFSLHDFTLEKWKWW